MRSRGGERRARPRSSPWKCERRMDPHPREARPGNCVMLGPTMWSEDNFQYAIENTEVIVAPQGRIATFGQTSFRFFLISELMDQVNEVRVRNGRIHAERPQILPPDHYARLLLEGF